MREDAYFCSLPERALSVRLFLYFCSCNTGCWIRSGSPRSLLQALADLYTWSGFAHGLSTPATEEVQAEAEPKEGSKEWVVEHVRGAASGMYIHL